MVQPIPAGSGAWRRCDPAHLDQQCLQGCGLFAYQYIPPGDLIAAANKLSAFSFLVIYVSFSLVFLLLQTVLFWPFVETFLFKFAFWALRNTKSNQKLFLFGFVLVMFAMGVLLHEGTWFRKIFAGVYCGILSFVYFYTYNHESPQRAFLDCFKVHAWSNLCVDLVGSVIPQYVAAFEAIS